MRAGERWAAASVLASAFAADPLVQALLPNPNDVRQRELFYDLQLRGLAEAGLCLVARQQHQVGAFFAFLPPHREISLWQQLSSGAEFVPLLGKRVPAALELQNVAAALHHRHAPDAWYVALVAVAPELQGQGWLRRVLAPLLDYAAQQGKSVYLETQNPSNVALYQHLGFELLETAPLQKLPGIKQHAMLAQPRVPSI